MGGCQIHFTVSSCAQTPRLAQSRPRAPEPEPGRGTSLGLGACLSVLLELWTGGFGKVGFILALQAGWAPASLLVTSASGHGDWSAPLAAGTDFSLSKQEAGGRLRFERASPSWSESVPEHGKEQIAGSGPALLARACAGQHPRNESPSHAGGGRGGGGWVKREGERRRRFLLHSDSAGLFLLVDVSFSSLPQPNWGRNRSEDVLLCLSRCYASQGGGPMANDGEARVCPPLI